MLLYALYALEKKKQGDDVKIRSEFPATTGIIVSCISLLLVFTEGNTFTPLVGIHGLGFSIRLDPLSATFLTMISILGFVILRFSDNYMDGDLRKNIFLCRLAVTIASVQLLILSGNLFQITVFWVITSVCLHHLLVFYRHRPQAIAAARKKFMVARVGDISLIGAVAILYATFETGDIDSIVNSIKLGAIDSNNLVLASSLLVVAALFKSAQFPTHGWLIEVVETPTPVSALLHAGLLNAGPFLMVRLSFIINEVASSSLLLLTVGGFTALFASVVYLTQPSVKISLGYSSIAHMGFSFMLCGLGVYSAAILHIVGHSFYKAHAFLSSGSIVESVQTKKITSPKRIGNPVLSVISLFLAYGVFALCSSLLGIDASKEFSLMIVAGIIIMGLSQFLVQIFDAKSPINVLIQSSLLASGVAASFLMLEHGARTLLSSQIPDLVTPNFTIQATAWAILICFGIVIGIQLMPGSFQYTKVGYQLGIHLRNGLYANVLFDRMIGSLKNEKFKWANLTVQEELKHNDSDLSNESQPLVKKAEMLLKD